MSDKESVKISGELFWSKWMAEFNKAFSGDNKKYECTIGMLSDEDVAKLTSLGIRVKYKDSMGNFIVAKSLFLFNPIDKNGNLVAVESIGNGSKCEAVIEAFEHKMSAKYGKSPSIVYTKKDGIHLWVTKVKTYVPDAKQEDDDVL